MVVGEFTIVNLSYIHLQTPVDKYIKALIYSVHIYLTILSSFYVNISPKSCFLLVSLVKQPLQ
jgi:hypothetical protein